MRPLKRHSKGSFEDRARSVPYRRCYVTSVSLCVASYICMMGALAAFTFIIPYPGIAPGTTLGVLVLLSGIFWLLSLFKRREATCPLCKGTPLLDSKARTHQKAVRFLPLNYGTTNVIRIIFRQQFRCHFCGTPYDLLKTVSAQQPPSVEQVEELEPPDLPRAVIPPIYGTLPQEGLEHPPSGEHQNAPPAAPVQSPSSEVSNQ